MSARVSYALIIVTALLSSQIQLTYSRQNISNSSARRLSYRMGSPGKRTIDALSGSCGTFPNLEKWNTREDVFCKSKKQMPKHEIRAEPVVYGEFPSHVLLKIRYGSLRDEQSCAGILVHADAVLTANNCIKDGARSVLAVAGTLTMGGDDGSQESYAYGYCRLFNKDRYNAIERNNNVLILLEKPFTFDDRVQPACIELQRDPFVSNYPCYAVFHSYSEEAKTLKLVSVQLFKCVTKPEGLEVEKVRWGRSAGDCYLREVPEGTQLRRESAIAIGAGLYCKDTACGSMPAKIYATGIITTGPSFETFSEKPNVAYEEYTVAKIKERQSEMIGMMENCYELPDKTPT